MKTANSYKIITFIILCFLAFACAFLSLNAVPVRAASNAGSYFLLNGEKSEKISFEESSLTATVETGDVLSFVNELSANYLELNVSVPAGITKYSVNLTATAYGANGNENAQGKFDTEIKNVLAIENNSASLNGGSAVSFGNLSNTKIVFGVNNNFLTASVNETSVISSMQDYYKLSFVDKVKVKVSFSFEEVDYSATFKLNSVSQSASNSSYTQNFVLDAENNLTKALPVVTLKESFFNKNAKDITVISGYQYSVSITPLAVLGGSSADYKIVANTTESSYTNMVVAGSSIMFKLSDADYNAGTSRLMAFDVVNKGNTVIETYKVNVVTDKGNNGVAPKYLDASTVQNEIESFKKALYNKTRAEYEVNGVKEEHYVRIGTGEYLEIPSLLNLVVDNANSYSDLTMTIRYRNKISNWSASNNNKIPLNVAGTYEFYVMFKDVNGNSMKIEDFIEEKDGETEYGEYSSYIFSFTVLDDAPITVTAAKQGKGFKGIEFNATAFTIKASDYTETYKLYYREDETKTWVELPKLSDIEEDYNQNGFTYKDIEELAYNGSLTFTPVKLGEYRIECSVVSNNTLSKGDTAFAVIKVNDMPTTVVPDNHWFENNIWSVLFLTVGTISLVAVIILLCVKPKNDLSTKRKK